MNFGFTPEQEKIRQDVRDFLKQEVTPELVEETFKFSHGVGPVGSIGRQFVAKLGARRWLCSNWPEEYGGLNSSEMVRFIIHDELSYAMVPQHGLIGATMAGPTILRVGSEKMKEEYLSRIARGEIEFTLGYTEPEAGSDLAAIKIYAEDRGDYFLINGQKMFNTTAHYADYHWLGARTETNPSVPRQRGISLMVVDLKSPGITVRSMTSIAGDKTNEVFYDNVRVPKENLVGEKNRGFYYIMTALDFERVYYMGLYRRFFDELLKYVKETKRNGRYIAEEPLVRQKLGELATEIEAAYLLYYRLADLLDKGEVPNYQSSIQKVFGSETVYRLADLATHLMGPRGQIRKGARWAPLEGEGVVHYLYSFIESIYMGSSEIQRNIIATRGLGLPR